MKSLFAFLIAVVCGFTAQAQTTSQAPTIDPQLAKKISISGICLCQTSYADLEHLANDLKPVEVEEMDLPKNCYGQDARYENGRGYSSDKYPGVIFQKDPNTDYISKIRLTKDFKGKLPNGTPIDLQNLTVKEVLKSYPQLAGKWGSRGCSNFLNVGNDTISFFVKIDTNKNPQYPVDTAYYSERPIEGIDLKISCYSVLNRPNIRLSDDPVFFVDSLHVTGAELQNYQPTDIAVLTVYKDTSAIKLLGEEGRNGAVFIETKKFAKVRYWNFFKTKSPEYFKVVPTPDKDNSVTYILNDSVLVSNFEGDLSQIDDKSFVSIEVIGKSQLRKDFGIKGKSFGIKINTNIKRGEKVP
jgi:hypothetical protein